MKKKTISLLMAASLAASSLAGGIVSFAEESDPITLSVWAPFTGSDGDVLREIIDNYNETNTDNITVQIDIMDNATLQSKLPTAEAFDSLCDALAHADALPERADDLVRVGLFQLIVMYIFTDKIVNILLLF